MPVDVGFVQSLSRNLVLAAYLNWGLMGILCIQVYAYYIAFPRDLMPTKTLVYTVFVLEIAQTVLTSHDIFIALGSSIGAEDSLSVVNLIYHHWFSIPVSGGITGGIGQYFFAYRVWRMSKSNYSSGQLITTMARSNGTPVIIAMLATGSLISALVCASTFFHARTFSILLGTDTDSGATGSMASIGVWNGIGAICDIVIALSMPYYLMRHGTGLPATHIVVVKLVRLIIETGAFTAIIAILHLCLYFGGTPAFIVPGLALSKVYANTMLVILNNRMEIVAGRRQAQTQGHEESQLSLSCDVGASVDANGSRSGRSGLVFASKPGRTRARSTIIVSNDRLTFRMDDMPPLTPKAEYSSRSVGSELETVEEHDVMNVGKVHEIPQFMASESEVRSNP